MGKNSKRYQELYQFLTQSMRMSHIYQPLIIMELLKGPGTETVHKLALACLAYDEAQIEYYIGIVKRYPKQTLLKHKIISVRKTESFELSGFKNLSQAERDELRELCQSKIIEFIASLQGLIGAHRLNLDAVESSLRYRVLKASKQKCALCGVHAKDSPIDVDHIVPRSKGGSNDMSNLQALCYRCNRGKGNRDETDFREELSL